MASDLHHLAAERGAPFAPALLFVHGAFASPWVWAQRFMPYFAARGLDSFALTLPGAGQQAFPAHEPGLDDYLEAIEAAVDTIARPTVVVGHSLGALAAQMALGRVPMAGLAMLAPAPPTGMLWSSMRLVLDAPALWARTVLSAADAGFATPHAARDALFSSDTPDEIVIETYLNMLAQPARPLVEAQWPRYVPRAARLGVPALAIGAGRDRLIAAEVVARTARHHGAEHVHVADSAHAMMLDVAWEQTAGHLLRWLGAVGDRVERTA